MTILICRVAAKKMTKISFIAASLFCFSAYGNAETIGDREIQSSSAEIDEWLETAAALNKPSMVDPAGSHGSFGIDLGAGVSQLSTNSKNRVTSTELGGTTPDEGRSSVSVPKVWISKGTILPVDFTLTGGSTQDQEFASAGGIMQVTIFEARGLPAVSVRGMHGRTFGKNDTQVQTNSGELAVSMGFFSYFQVYATSSVDKHKAQIKINPSSDIVFLLRESTEGEYYEKEWQRRSHALGIKCAILPGRLNVTAETTGFSTAEDAFTVRLSTYL
jgi:hypothetical protein